MTKYSAFGTQLFRGTSGGGTAIAQVRSFDGPALSVDMIDVTTMDSTNAFEEVVAGIIRSGEVSFDIEYDPANATHKNAGNGLLADLVARTATTWTFVFPDAASTEWSFSGFVNNFTPSAPHDADLTASASIKITGDMTIA